MNTEQAETIIKEFEGCSLTPYQDSGGIWTAGFGHIRGVKSTTVVTLSLALQWLAADLAQTAIYVQADVKVSLNENELAALLSFTFNEGAGHLAGSTLLAKLNAGDRAGAAAEFPQWDKCRGQIVAGLDARRLAEQTLFLSPIVEPVQCGAV